MFDKNLGGPVAQTILRAGNIFTSGARSWKNAFGSTGWQWTTTCTGKASRKKRPMRNLQGRKAERLDHALPPRFNVHGLLASHPRSKERCRSIGKMPHLPAAHARRCELLHLCLNLYCNLLVHVCPGGAFAKSGNPVALDSFPPIGLDLMALALGFLSMAAHWMTCWWPWAKTWEFHMAGKRFACTAHLTDLQRRSFSGMSGLIKSRKWAQLCWLWRKATLWLWSLQKCACYSDIVTAEIRKNGSRSFCCQLYRTIFVLCCFWEA